MISDARGLEEAFFTKENAQLLAQQQEKNQCEAFREVVQVEDDLFLDRFIELSTNPETVLALTLVLLTAIAWATAQKWADFRLPFQPGG